MEILYEDNHLIVVNKRAGEIVQGDKTGDRTLSDDVKAYIKETCAKPGAVFLGLPHRLDRPVSGVCVFARTSKALERMNRLFREGEVRKTYHAIVCQPPREPQAELRHLLVRNEKRNKTYVVPPPASSPASLNKERVGTLTAEGESREDFPARHSTPPSPRKGNGGEAKTGAKLAVLDYRTLAHSDRYTLLEVHLHTGRHHQIRCQLAAIGCPIKGDLKYGAPRSNPDGSICLHARSIEFEHPVTHKTVRAEAPYPALPVWHIWA